MKDKIAIPEFSSTVITTPEDRLLVSPWSSASLLGSWELNRNHLNNLEMQHCFPFITSADCVWNVVALASTCWCSCSTWDNETQHCLGCSRYERNNRHCTNIMLLVWGISRLVVIFLIWNVRMEALHRNRGAKKDVISWNWRWRSCRTFVPWLIYHFQFEIASWESYHKTYGLICLPSLWISIQLILQADPAAQMVPGPHQSSGFQSNDSDSNRCQIIVKNVYCMAIFDYHLIIIWSVQVIWSVHPLFDPLFDPFFKMMIISSWYIIMIRSFFISNYWISHCFRISPIV